MIFLVYKDCIFSCFELISYYLLHVIFSPIFRYRFVPHIIFLNSLFGYLSLLIIVKWCTGSKVDLYHVKIYMFLSPTDDLGENQLFIGQKFIQVWILFCFPLCWNSLTQFSRMVANLLVFVPLIPYFIVIDGSSWCAMDAVSKAVLLEEVHMELFIFIYVVELY